MAFIRGFTPYRFVGKVPMATSRQNAFIWGMAGGNGGELAHISLGTCIDHLESRDMESGLWVYSTT